MSVFEINHIVESVDLPINTTIIGPTIINKLKEYFIKHNQKDYSDLINISGYSNVRNLCLLIPAIKNADLAVLIDDDEVFQDSEFISKVKKQFTSPIRKDETYGIAGYYVNGNGDYLVKKIFSPWMKHWNKTQKMNEAFTKIIGNPPRIKETPFVFGGNMIIPKKLYSTIMFDPNIPRGEDIDYLMNARMHGFTFYLDNQLQITHLPPPKSHPTWQRLREDIYRFLYEREKIRKQEKNSNNTKITAEEFDPYPGNFLKDDLEDKIIKANSLLAEEYKDKNKSTDYNETKKNTDEIIKKAIPSFDPVEKYEKLRTHWIHLICSLQKEDAKQELNRIINLES